MLRFCIAPRGTEASRPSWAYTAVVPLRFDYSFNLVFHEPPRKVVYCQSHPAITRVCHCAAKRFLRMQSKAAISTRRFVFTLANSSQFLILDCAKQAKHSNESLFTSFSLLWSKVKWHMQAEHKLLHKSLELALERASEEVKLLPSGHTLRFFNICVKC